MRFGGRVRFLVPTRVLQDDVGPTALDPLLLVRRLAPGSLQGFQLHPEM